MTLNFSSLEPLNGIRGLCSLIIVVGHFFTSFAPVKKEDYPSVSVEYFSPVTLFFVISGFVLVIFYPQEKLSSRAGVKLFFWKRVARLAPIYYFSLVCCLPSFLYYSWNNSMDLFGGALAALFLQSFTLIGNAWNPPVWQVSAFLFCYLLYPFVQSCITSRRSWTALLPLYLVPLGALAWFIAKGLPVGIIHIWVGFRIPQFLIGCIVGNLYKKSCEDGADSETSNLLSITEPPAKRKERNWGIFADLLSLVLLGSFAACAVGGSVYGAGFWWTYMLVAEYVVVPLHCAWIWVIARSSRGFTVAFMKSKLLLVLGELSLSIYCLQWAVLYGYSWLKVGLRAPKIQFRDRKFKMGSDTTVDGPFVLENFEIVSVFVYSDLLRLDCSHVR